MKDKKEPQQEFMFTSFEISVVFLLYPFLTLSYLFLGGSFNVYLYLENHYLP